jgi:hypothetical protein
MSPKNIHPNQKQFSALLLYTGKELNDCKWRPLAGQLIPRFFSFGDTVVAMLNYAPHHEDGRRCTLDMRLGGPQSLRENFDEEEKLLPLPGIKPGHPVPRLLLYQSAIQGLDMGNKRVTFSR